MYATESSSVTWQSISAATLSNVNYVGGGKSANATNTFTATGSFTVANRTISAVPQTYTYNSSGIQTSWFREGVLSDGTANEIFVTIIESDKEGFDSDGNTSTTTDQYDFQMIVPVNETSQTSYYFYLELS